MQIDFSLIEPVDFLVSHAIQSIASNPLDLLINAITMLGNPAFWIIIAAIIYWKGKERESFFLMNLIVFSAAVVAVAKTFFLRPRPSNEEFRVIKDLIPKLEDQGFDYSFPSGHTSLVSGIFFYAKNFSKKIKILFVLLIFAVAFSRIYLGKHFLSDVLAGLLLGFIVGKANYFLRKLVEKKELKLTKIEEELGLILCLIGVFIAINFLKSPALSLVVLGYYAGFFLLKELNIDSKNVEGKKFLTKTAIGLTGLGIAFVSISFFDLSQTIEIIAYFFAGAWISLIWPFLFEKLAK